MYLPLSCTRLSPLAAVLLLMSSSACSDNLIDIYELALANDPEIAAELATQKEKQETLTQQRGKFLPTIELSGDTTSHQQDVSTTGIGATGKTRFNSKDLTFTLEQPLFRHDLFIRLRQAQAVVRKADSDYAYAEQSLILRVVERYFDYLRTEDNLRFIRSEIAAAKEQLGQVQNRFDLGTSTAADLYEVQANYHISLTNQLEAENALSSARQGLKQLTGREHHSLAPFDKSKALMRPQPDEVGYWIEATMKNNSELESARQALKFARHDVELARGGHFPEINLVAEHSNVKGGGRFGESSTQDNSVGIEFRLPLFQGGQVRSRIREASHKLTSTQMLYEKKRRVLERNAHDAFYSVRTALDRSVALEQAIKSAEAARQAVIDGFAAGTRTPVEVLKAEQKVLKTAREQTNAVYDYFINLVYLKQVSGQLTRTDLESVNAWLR